MKKLKNQLAPTSEGDLKEEHVKEISKRLNVKEEEVVSDFSMPNLTIQDQRNIQPPQVNLRQRAARNPYLASSLLGGLGSASLLNR